MPEGDTVWRTADRLDRALSGREITRSDLRWGDLATADLRGTTTVEVVARGKHILQRLDSGHTLHSHLKMEGAWRIEATDALGRGALTNPGVRAVVATDDWTGIGLRLGMLDLVPTEREGDLVGHLGPDILGDDWDVEQAVANVRASGTTLGAALLDQRNLAGIGTLWDSEVLFAERLHPWADAASIEQGALAAALRRAHRWMTAALGHAVQSTTGSRRQGENTYVHGRSGRPCRRCEQTVRVAMIGPPGQERTMFYCPGCQGGLGPTDDGTPQAPLGASRTSPTRSRATYRGRRG
ncbi:MAG: Fpg/Nei family DNA glycosylase [Micrococcales bacterium]|nr:Fpg/Nei family DNA glycosylase [Micrococcales bacterium]